MRGAPATFLVLAILLASPAAARDACDHTADDLVRDGTLHKCLPDTIPLNLQLERFTEFHAADGVRTPLSSIPISIDGKEADASVAQALFLEDHWIRLPKKTRITVLPDQNWRFPTGTVFLHRIFLRNRSKPSLYEARLMKSLPSGAWAFGAYVPSKRDPSLLALRKDEGVTFEARLDSGTLRLRRISTWICRDCHDGPPFEMSPLAGPCGFTPENPKVLGEWAPEFRARKGYWPFR